LPITGQLEFDTSKALGAVPAVVKSNQQSDAADPARTSEIWRRLRKSDEKFLKNLNAREKAARQSNLPAPGSSPGSANDAEAGQKEKRPVAPAPPAEGPGTTGEVNDVRHSNAADSANTERSAIMSARLCSPGSIHRWAPKQIFSPTASGSYAAGTPFTKTRSKSQIGASLRRNGAVASC
jgi:hypothetical protein